MSTAEDVPVRKPGERLPGDGSPSGDGRPPGWYPASGGLFEAYYDELGEIIGTSRPTNAFYEARCTFMAQRAVRKLGLATVISIISTLVGVVMLDSGAGVLWLGGFVIAGGLCITGLAAAREARLVDGVVGAGFIAKCLALACATVVPAVVFGLALLDSGATFSAN